MTILQNANRVAPELENHPEAPEHAGFLGVGTSIRDFLFDILLAPKKPKQIIIVDSAQGPGNRPGEVFEIDIDEINPKKTSDFAKTQVFPPYLETVQTLGVINTGFLGTVDNDGALNLYDGKLRLMKPDGSYTDFDPQEYTDYLTEQVVPWSYGKFPYASSWNEGFSLDLDAPKGIYRANCLARINAADKFTTPKAQAELEEFREQFGRPAQATLLYHWARLIEGIYACVHAIELLNGPEITDPNIRAEVIPGAGRGVGCVEAPRGTLIHDYSTDENGLITRANMIVGTTHNLGPINMSVDQAARSLIQDGNVDEGILNKIEMSVRAYDP